MGYNCYYQFVTMCYKFHLDRLHKMTNIHYCYVINALFAMSLETERGKLYLILAIIANGAWQSLRISQ